MFFFFFFHRVRTFKRKQAGIYTEYLSIGLNSDCRSLSMKIFNVVLGRPIVAEERDKQGSQSGARRGIGPGAKEQSERRQVTHDRPPRWFRYGRSEQPLTDLEQKSD
jgi:hypothetical protein